MLEFPQGRVPRVLNVSAEEMEAVPYTPSDAGGGELEETAAQAPAAAAEAPAGADDDDEAVPYTPSDAGGGEEGEGTWSASSRRAARHLLIRVLARPRHPAQ